MNTAARLGKGELHNKMAGDAHEAARREVRDLVRNGSCHFDAYADRLRDQALLLVI